MGKDKRIKMVKAIEAEMRRQGLTAYALAKRVRVDDGKPFPAATITRILTGARPKPGAETLERLAEALGAEFVLTLKGKK